MYRKTKIYRHLDRRINTIEKHFVRSFLRKNVVNLSERQMDLCRGYKVLCHAELEYYFEEIAKIIVDESLWRWQNEQIVTFPIIGLLGNFEKIETNDNVETKINQVAKDYLNKIVKKNHGIKEENLKRLYFNLGINISEFDATWVAMLSSYGASRGMIAHTSVAAQNPVNIQEASAETKHILEGIEAFEKEIEKQTKLNLYIAEKRIE